MVQKFDFFLWCFYGLGHRNQLRYYRIITSSYIALQPLGVIQIYLTEAKAYHTNFFRMKTDM
jgi:hypothetical protein